MHFVCRLLEPSIRTERQPTHGRVTYDAGTRSSAVSSRFRHAVCYFSSSLFCDDQGRFIRGKPGIVQSHRPARSFFDQFFSGATVISGFSTPE